MTLPINMYCTCPVGHVSYVAFLPTWQHCALDHGPAGCGMGGDLARNELSKSQRSMKNEGISFRVD